MSGETVTKAGLRKEMQARLHLRPTNRRAAESDAICTRVQSSVLWVRARSILFFAARPDEPDLGPLLRDALATGRIVCLPGYHAEREGYEALRIRSPESDLVSGRFRVLEPAPGCPRVALNQLDLVLVPGVAFDGNGRRLGRGQGYYDRLLSGVTGTKCGVLWDEQWVPNVPVEPHDVRLNCLVTPSRWHVVSGGAAF